MSMVFAHKKLAEGRWFTLSIAEQMGNIGSEVERALSWRQRGKQQEFEKAFARALELIDLTLADHRLALHRRREVARAREVLCDLCYGGNEFGTSVDQLRKYFLQFGILARKNR